MAKARRKSRSSNRRPNVLGLAIVLMVGVILGYLYWQQYQKTLEHPGRHISLEQPLDSMFEDAPENQKSHHHITVEEPSGPRSKADSDRNSDLPSDPEVDALLHRYDNSSRKYLFAGAPRPLAHQSIKTLINAGYEVGYSEEAHDPLWVACRLFRHIQHHIAPRPEEFAPDTRTLSQIGEAAYSHSEFDRGHMAPNSAIAECYGDEAQRQTFLMSNVVPQKKLLNREVWKRLEEKILDDWAMHLEEVWVITGPVFADHPPTLREGVEIPDECYKIVIRENHAQPTALAFLCPQNVSGHEPLETFLTSIRRIETRTHMEFFPDLQPNVQESLETSTASSLW